MARIKGARVPPSTRASLLAALAALAALLLPGCLGEPSRVRIERELKAIETEPWADPHQVVFEVNGRAVTRGEFYRRILEKFDNRRWITGMIKEELFLQEAARRGITVSKDDVRARVEEMLAEEAARAGGEAELEKIYRQQGMTLLDLREEFARGLESQLLAERVTRSLRRLDDAALRDYYSRTYAKTRYRVRHIPYAYPLQGRAPDELGRLKTAAREKAERTVKRIREGADFGLIARQESEDATGEAGGEIGYLTEDMEIDPAMRAVIFKLKPGEVSDPVENNVHGAYHVVQVTEVLPHQSFAEAQERMRNEILQSEPDRKEIDEAAGALKADAAISILGQPVGAGQGPGAGGGRAR